jgi:hypothetical protein
MVRTSTTARPNLMTTMNRAFDHARVDGDRGVPEWL